MISAIGSIRDILISGNDFILSGHINPDGDSIGSCFALAMALKNAGKQVQVVMEPFSRKYDIIPGRELLFNGDINSLAPEHFIALDCSSPDRLGDAAKLFDRAEVTICIDHHLYDKTYAMYNYIIPDISSTSELVYNVIKGIFPISTGIASAIYGGMLYDTGGFRHSNTGADTHLIAGRLIELGIRSTDIYNSLMYSHSYSAAKIFGKALDNMKLTSNGRIAYSYSDGVMMRQCGATSQDLDGISEYILNTVGVEAAVFFSERKEGEIRASLRSKNTDVSVVAKQFGGGGHKNAAGCTIAGTTDEAAAKLLPLLEKAVS